jgi:biopolymer transport protein ExbB/TolQ
MQNLIYLIIMALAGGAGWYAGSWKGRDLQQAVDKARAVAEEAVASRDKIERDLKASQADLVAKFEQAQQARDANHAKVTDELKTALANSDKTVAELKRARAGTEARIRQNDALIESSTTTAAERARLLAENEKLRGDIARQQAQIAGFECANVPVPDKLLSPLQRS